INVLESDINLTGNGCTAQDKKDLAKLIWADGNLKSTGNSNYVWTTSTDRGYYYTWYSTYTGNTSQNNTDPCSKLNISTYGTGWRTPSRNELTKLSRCTNKAKVNNGMWFMNSSKGLFLPLAGHTPSASGASTGNGVVNSNLDGNYWCTEKYYRFLFGTNGHTVSDAASGAFGCSVRCVKGTKQ
ncbi:hypothetical protein K0G07_20015, partial [Bacteroides fragilis]|nr:hypothetical protein [Bacteroides fragilis]